MWNVLWRDLIRNVLWRDVGKATYLLETVFYSMFATNFA